MTTDERKVLVVDPDAIFALQGVLGTNDHARGTLYGFDVDVTADVEGQRLLVRAQ